MTYALKIDIARYDILFQNEIYDLGLYPLNFEEAENLINSGRLYEINTAVEGQAEPILPGNSLNPNNQYALDISLELYDAYKNWPDESRSDTLSKQSFTTYVDSRLLDPDHIHTLKLYIPEEIPIYNL